MIFLSAIAYIKFAQSVLDGSSKTSRWLSLEAKIKKKFLFVHF